MNFRIRQWTGILCLLSLLGQKNSLDVGEDTTLGNGDSSKKLVQLLVITDGQLEVAGDDSGLLVVTGSIACQLKNLSSQVLHDGSQVDWGNLETYFSLNAHCTFADLSIIGKKLYG